MLYGPVSIDAIADKLISDIWSACRSKDNIAHHDTLWRATALLTSILGMYSNANEMKLKLLANFLIIIY